MYHYSLIFSNITMIEGVASLQLPVKYYQLPAVLIGYIGTLIWCRCQACQWAYIYSLAILPYIS